MFILWHFLTIDNKLVAFASKSLNIAGIKWNLTMLGFECLHFVASLCEVTVAEEKLTGSGVGVWKKSVTSG